jgi:hypothetical protein
MIKKPMLPAAVSAPLSLVTAAGDGHTVEFPDIIQSAGWRDTPRGAVGLILKWQYIAACWQGAVEWSPARR